MMKPSLKSLSVAIASLLPRPALALEASFHSYDGFAETVDAFRLVSMIFADARYETLVLIVAVVGISIGAVLASIRGSGMGIVAFGFQILVGVGLFVGLISTTGTVHVYDRVRNAYQPVGSVPNLLVLVAGVTNLMERALAETIDDNSLDPRSKLEFGAGGHAFDLFLNATSPKGPMVDTYLDATIKDYVRHCYPVARVSPVYGVDDDSLLRTTTDLPASFAAMAGPATFATVYTPAQKGGATMSCNEAWTQISGRLSEPDLFDRYMRQVCQRTGYAIEDAGQLARCRSRLGEMGDMMLGRPLSAQMLFTDILLGTGVGDVLFEDSPASAARTLANRAVTSSGLATMSVANEWMPTIRATVFGIMLFMVPVALLFILTPINLRVASFSLGLFIFVALWGVIDAGLYQLTLGRAMGVLAEMRGNALGANAWALAPSSAMKALAIFGSFRTAAAGIAGAFVFTIFRFSGNMFSSLTGSATSIQNQGSAAAAPLSTAEGYANLLEAQASAAGSMARKNASANFADFGERATFSANRGFGAAGAIVGESSSAMTGETAFGVGRIDAAKELGALAPAIGHGNLSDPATARAVRANAVTGAIHDYADKDALRSLGTGYFGEGDAGERSFAAFAHSMVQWKAFGDNQAYEMMLGQATRHFSNAGYDRKDAVLKASGIIADAAADPTLAKVSANAFDQEQMLKNELTAAQAQVGAMEGRRDYAGDHVAQSERANVATEQARRTGGNAGQREAAAMLGIPVDETARRISFVEALTGEARSSAISQLAKSTGRNEAQVVKALEIYRASSDLGTADGATHEAAREGTSVYARTKDAAVYDFAERSGKLDAQKEVGPDGTRQAARIGEQRRQAENFGYEAGAAAAGRGVREAAKLESFMAALQQTVGNQLDMAEGGPEAIADRARNSRMAGIVDRERLTRVQQLLKAHGIDLSKRHLAMGQNGDFSLNLTPQMAADMWKGGLINESQLGAIANGGQARFSFANNDLLVSSSTRHSQSARSDTSTRFEAGKQAGPDTIEHFMGGGAEGQEMLANWLRGGFEMNRKGEWRLKPQVADTLQRDVQAIMMQTGWRRSITREAADRNSFSFAAGLSGGAGGTVATAGQDRGRRGPSNSFSGKAGQEISMRSSEEGAYSETATASLDTVNYDVRSAINQSEEAAGLSADPHRSFAEALGKEIIGNGGLRDRYLQQSQDGRGTFDLNSPLTSIEQSFILQTGRSALDGGHGPEDGGGKR